MLKGKKGLAVMEILKHIVEVAKKEENSRVEVEINGMEFGKGNGSPKIKFQPNGSGLKITASNNGVSQSILFLTKRPKQLKNKLFKALRIEEKKLRK